MPRVSIDGQSHEMLTLITCVSGFVVASLVIVAVVMAIRRVDMQPQPQCQNHTINRTEEESNEDNKRRTNKGRSSIFTIFSHSRQSFDVEHNV